jgi:hypothetical protein
MRKRIEKLVRVILPATGRRRAPSVSEEASPHPQSPPRARSGAEYAPTEDPAIVLVRPYVLAHERRVEHERRLRRRAGLVMAPQGVVLTEGVA